MAANYQDEDALAYGEYHGRGPTDEEETYQGEDRGIIGDTYRRWRDRHQPQPMQNQVYGAVSRTPAICTNRPAADPVSFWLCSPTATPRIPPSPTSPTLITTILRTLLTHPTDRMEVRGRRLGSRPVFLTSYTASFMG